MSDKAQRKELLSQYKHDEEFKSMFAREAAAYARLGHPSIVRLYDFFSHGEQLVMVGRYKKAGSAKVTISGKVGGKEQKFDFPASFIEKSSDQSHAFVEKLWAMRRIGQTFGNALMLPGERPILVKALSERFEGWLPAYMAAGVA